MIKFNKGYYRRQGRKEGIVMERERIIKLLEHMPRTDNDRTIDAPTLIELIKGENK